MSFVSFLFWLDAIPLIALVPCLIFALFED